MTWQAYVFDTVTGQLAQQLDVPSFSWSVSVSDCSFSTTTSKNVGEDEISGLQLPWSSIPGSTPMDRAAVLQPYRRGLVLLWKTTYDDAGSLGAPIVAGAFGVRSSTLTDVSVPTVSIKGLLQDRYLVHENSFGKADGHTTSTSYTFTNLSWRALACEVIRECTSNKPGGSLPIDLPYLGESGTHSLPSDGDESVTTTGKTKKRVDTSDGYVETTVNGDTTTVTEQHVNQSTKKITVTEPYTYTDKNGNKVTKTRTREKTITTGKTTTTTKNVTKNHADYAERTVTVTTTVTSYDENGKQIGSDATTGEPVKTILPRQTISVYHDYNISSHRCADILDSIANSDGGPDMQFRPYMADSQHVRFNFVAGSDGDVYLNQSTRLSLSCHPHGGTLEDVQIDRDAPYMRVYATGSGSGSGTLCALAEDLSMVNREDPWPLRESVVSDSDSRTWSLLESAANGTLAANRNPLAQFSGTIDVDDMDATGRPLHPLGSFWPGEVFDIAVDGYPDWPDGIYPMRLMTMSGDETSKVTLKFDPIVDVTA